MEKVLVHIFAAWLDHRLEDYVSGKGQIRQGDSLREIKTKKYSWGIAVAIVGLGIYSFHVRELLAALTLFSAAFLLLALVVLGAFLIWSASRLVANWSRPASRNVIAFSRRLIAPYSRPRGAMKFPSYL